jgi:glutathione peroxidase
MFAKIDVNGADTHPLYAWLKSEKSGLLGGAIKWNFTKFLLDRSGHVVDRYAPQTEPAELVADIEELLAASVDDPREDDGADGGA